MQRRASRGTARGRLALGCGAVHACAGAIERIAAADPRSGGAAARPRRNRSRCEQQTIPRPRPNAVHIRASRTSLRWTHPCSLVRCVYGHGRSGGRMWRRRAVDVDQAAVAPDAGGREVVITDDAGGRRSATHAWFRSFRSAGFQSRRWHRRSRFLLHTGPRLRTSGGSFSWRCSRVRSASCSRSRRAGSSSAGRRPSSRARAASCDGVCRRCGAPPATVRSHTRYAEESAASPAASPLGLPPAPPFPFVSPTPLVRAGAEATRRACAGISPRSAACDRSTVAPTRVAPPGEVGSPRRPFVR